MPKGVQNANPEILERLKVRVCQSMTFQLNTNKTYNLLSNVIFEKTGAILSNSTLRRVCQYDSFSHPTKCTLDLICITIGFRDWNDFIEKERNQSQPDLSQLITQFKFLGSGDPRQTRQILEKFISHPNFFSLLDVVAQAAIAERNFEFLTQIFDMGGAFEIESNRIPMIYFIHKLVIGLNQSGLMPELIESYGSNPMAQAHLIESFVDEDNLTGYYYDLLQVYHQYKTTPEALLFYNCLMYQHAIENKLAKDHWVNLIRQFSGTMPVHHIPEGRRLAILMLEADDSEDKITDIFNRTTDLFRDLNDIEKIKTALYMVKLLFFKRKDELIDRVLLITPDISGADKGIDDLTDINQIKLYRSYSFFRQGEKGNARLKLQEFNPVLVHTFIYNHIMNDFRVVSDLLANE